MRRQPSAAITKISNSILSTMNEEIIRACIAACQSCAVQCDQCAISCSLSSDVNKLSKCIELDIYCADLCRMSVAFLGRGQAQAKQLCALCAEICELCAIECEKHARKECQKCALLCRACVEECRKTAALFSSAGEFHSGHLLASA